MLIFPIVILTLIVVILLGSGMWLVFFAKEVKASSNLSTASIFGWLGVAVLLLFFKPRDYIWKGWQKNFLGSIFIIIGLIIVFNLIKYILEIK